MPEFTITRCEVVSLKDELGNNTGQQVFSLAYDLPGVPEMDGHVHLIPLAAVANYQLEHGGGTVEEAISYFILDLMQAGYDENQVATAVPVARNGKLQRIEAKRKRLERLAPYVDDVARREAEIGVPATGEEMVRIVANSMMDGMDTGASRANLNAARKRVHGAHADTTRGFSVNTSAPGWKQLQRIAGGMEERMAQERERQVNSRWGQRIRHIAWETHRKRMEKA